MAYEIDIVFIAPNCGNELELLNAKAAEGWLPYAISGNSHYFRKGKQGSYANPFLSAVASAENDAPKKKKK